MERKSLILNFKAYEESAGAKGESLAKTAEKVASDLGANIIIAPPVVCASYARLVGIPVFGQDAEMLEPGARTGHVTIESMKQCGLAGTLLNHSECRATEEQVKFVCERARKVGGFDVCVCAKDVPEAVKYAQYQPAAIAVEPPELIGSGISVSSARPEIVSESVAAIKKVSPNTLALVGAGVSNATDVATSLRLGAEGVLLASAFVKAKDPEAWLRDVAKELV